MKILETKEFDNDDEYKKYYTLDESIQIESFTDVVRQFETKDNIMMECSCHSFSDDGSPSYNVFYKPEDILSMKSAPNPYVSFYADFCDKNTGNYKFGVQASTNSNILVYEINKKKLENSQSVGHTRS